MIDVRYDEGLDFDLHIGAKSKYQSYIKDDWRPCQTMLVYMTAFVIT